MKQLKDAIEKSGINQKTFIHELGVSRSTFWSWLNDIHEIPAAKLKRLSEMLCLPMEYLLDGSANRSNEMLIKKIKVLETKNHEIVGDLEVLVKKLKASK